MDRGWIWLFRLSAVLMATGLVMAAWKWSPVATLDLHQVSAWPTASRTLESHETHVGHDRAWPQALSGTHGCAGR